MTGQVAAASTTASWPNATAPRPTPASTPRLPRGEGAPGEAVAGAGDGRQPGRRADHQRARPGRPGTAPRSAASRSRRRPRGSPRAPSGTEDVYKIYAESFKGETISGRCRRRRAPWCPPRSPDPQAEQGQRGEDQHGLRRACRGRSRTGAGLDEHARPAVGRRRPGRQPEGVGVAPARSARPGRAQKTTTPAIRRRGGGGRVGRGVEHALGDAQGVQEEEGRTGQERHDGADHPDRPRCQAAPGAARDQERWPRPPPGAAANAASSCPAVARNFSA